MRVFKMGSVARSDEGQSENFETKDPDYHPSRNIKRYVCS